MTAFNDIRHKIFRIIEPAQSPSDIVSYIYDLLMLAAIFMGIAPLMFKEQTPFLRLIDDLSLSWFVVDYVLRWLTADMHGRHKGIRAFILYPFTINAILDLLSILPSLTTVLNKSLKLLRLTRLLKIIRIYRVVRYFEPLQIIIAVLRKEGRVLMAVLNLALFYIFVTALVMFNVEYENELEGQEPMFATIFDAMYWSACTLTTVGYGDIYPVSSVGRLISMISAIVGVAIIALPSGVITGGYMDELRLRREKSTKQKKEKQENLLSSS